MHFSFSLTNATLRRLLRNYWNISSKELIIDDELMAKFWDGSILGQVVPIEKLETAICFLPIELSFLYDKATSKVVDFSVGKSRETNTRDLTEEERTKYMIIIHNHPRGDTFSLEDIVACAMKQAKEVRAITSIKSYIASLCLDASPNEYRDLINKTYLKVANNRAIEDALIA